MLMHFSWVFMNFLGPSGTFQFHVGSIGFQRVFWLKGDFSWILSSELWLKIRKPANLIRVLLCPFQGFKKFWAPSMWHLISPKRNHRDGNSSKDQLSTHHLFFPFNKNQKHWIHACHCQRILSSWQSCNVNIGGSRIRQQVQTTWPWQTKAISGAWSR